MAVPQTTPNTGNGSVIDREMIDTTQSFSQKDQFQENLERTSKPVDDGILYYPRDLFSNDEYRFGIRFDIYDASGDVLNEDRKIHQVTKSLGNFTNQLSANAREQREKLLNEGPNISAEVTAFASAAASAASSATTFAAEAIAPIIRLATDTEQAYDPEGRDSQVEGIVGVKSPQTKVASVFLYLPGNVSFSSDFDYEDADMGNIDFIRGIQGAAGVGNSEAQADIMRKMGMGFIKQNAPDAIGGEFLGNMMKIQQRQVENPFLVHLFKGVQRRSFTFDWEMVPRSPEEALNVYKIVQTFRRYAYPKRNPSGRFLDFPAEFDLTFLYQNKNMNQPIAIPKIKKCAIKGIKVDYGENVFVAHKPDPARGMPDAMPTKVKLNIQFSELSILARQEIERGY